MARIPIYDPLTSEARSPLIAGLTEAVNKISATLDLNISQAVDLPLTPIYVTDTDKFRIYQAPNGNRLWLEDPAPVVRRNGIQISPEDIDTTFTIDYVGGSIAFENNIQMEENDIITVDVTYITDESNTISEILESVARSDRFVGYYLDYATLIARYPTASAGNFAIVGGTDNSVYIWNSSTKTWENTFKETDLSDYYKKLEVNTLLLGKEDSISSHGEANDDDWFYFGGRKTWQDIRERVKSTQITDLDTTSPDEVKNGDTVSGAIGKLQAQISSYVHELFGQSAPTEETEGSVGQDYTDTSTGGKYHLVEVTSGGKYKWERYGDVLGIKFQISIPESGWSDKSISVTDTRLQSEDEYIYLLTPDSASSEKYFNCGVKANDVSESGSVTFVCDKIPDADLTVNAIRLEM